MRYLLLFLSLFAFYVALSGQTHNEYLMLAGLVTSLATTGLAAHLGICDREGFPYERFFAAFRYLPWLFKEILTSNLAVGRLVWSKELHIAPSVREHPHQLHSGFGLVSFANSITLTPGTVSVEAEDRRVVVHAVNQTFQADLESGGMLKRVDRLEGKKR